METLNTHKCYVPVFRCRRIIFFIFTSLRSQTHIDFAYKCVFRFYFNFFSSIFSLSLFLSLDLSISMSLWNYNEMNAVENDILEHRKHYVRCASLYSDMHSYSNITNIVKNLSLFRHFSLKIRSTCFLEYPNRFIHLSPMLLSIFLSLSN